MTIARHPCKPTSKRLHLLVGVWLVRWLLIGLLAYPLFHLFADSGILHSSQGDRRLFAAGCEVLFALLDARAATLRALLPTLWLLMVVSWVLSLLISSIVWVEATSPRHPLAMATRARVCRAIPFFAAIGGTATVIVAACGWCWWHAAPVVGAILEPELGERMTDFAQLAFALLILLGLACLLVFGDMLRARVVVRSCGLSAPVRLPDAGRLPFLHVTAQACMRFAPACLLQLGSAWLVSYSTGRDGLLWRWAIPVTSTELVALVTIWLRLDWIAWLTKRS